MDQRRTRQTQASVVSNVCDLRAGQLEDLLLAADKQLSMTGKRVLDPKSKALIVERNYDYLVEIADKVLAKVCPNNIQTHYSHLMSHYVIEDGRVNLYKNLDQNSPVVEVYARLKHPCSLAEKIGRKAAEYGRVGEFRDPHKLMIGDIIGLEIVVDSRENVQALRNQVMQMPCFALEKEEEHTKDNGYMARHLNLIYSNGNPLTRWLEVEIQITDKKSHERSKTDLSQAHDTTLKDAMIKLPRTLHGYKLYEVGNSVKLDPAKMEVLETDSLYIVRQVPNRIQQYTLVVPKEK